MTPLEWIAEQGIVMQSAQHRLFPSLVEQIAGEPIAGSWWGHEKGREIYRALVIVHGSPEVVATKLVDGKVTLIHRRLWAALATLAEQRVITAARLNRVSEQHGEAGRHEKREEPFPEWLPRGLKLPSLAEAQERIGAAGVAALRDGPGPRPAARATAVRAKRRKG
jgi:hypothetical protein